MKNFLKKAKGILKKIRKVYVRIKTRKLVGNFRYEKYWSDEAKNFMENREIFSFIEDNSDSLSAAFVKDVREYYSYYGEYDLQAIALAISLLQDVYSPDVLPLEICEEIFGKKRTAELMGKELFDLLCKFGGKDIVYHDDKQKKVPKGVRSCCHLNRRFFLTKRRVGMPVRMFLIWAKGGVTIPPGIMEELSGIPRRKISEAYSMLIKEFQYVIKEKHNWDRLEKQATRTSTVVY